MQQRCTDLQQRDRCDRQAAFGRGMRLSSAVWRVIWDEWMGLFIMSSDRMTNWLTPLREVLSYPSSLLSQTLSSSCFMSTNSATTNTLYDDVMSSIFNRKGKNVIYLSKIFHLQTILGSTNINYLHKKSMDSSMIDWLKQTLRLTYLKKRKWLHSLPQPTLNTECLKLASGVMLVSRPEGWTSPRITAFQADCSI